MVKILSAILFLIAFFSLTVLTFASSVGLGTASSFAVLSGAGITNTGATTVTGDMGTFPTTSESGFASITLHGVNHVGDSVTQGAKDDLITSYNTAAGRSPTNSIPTELGGSTLKPGNYSADSGTFGITGTLTLDGQGDPNAVFVFKMGSTLTTASASNVVLIGNLQSCNIFWQVGSSATLGTNSILRGNVLSLASITANTGAYIDGRLLARNGFVTLDHNTIVRSVCTTPTVTPPTTTPPTTTPPSATAPKASKTLPNTGANDWAIVVGLILLPIGLTFRKLGLERI